MPLRFPDLQVLFPAASRWPGSPGPPPPRSGRAADAGPPIFGRGGTAPKAGAGAGGRHGHPRPRSRGAGAGPTPPERRGRRRAGSRADGGPKPVHPAGPVGPLGHESICALDAGGPRPARIPPSLPSPCPPGALRQKKGYAILAPGANYTRHGMPWGGAGYGGCSPAGPRRR